MKLFPGFGQLRASRHTVGLPAVIQLTRRIFALFADLLDSHRVSPARFDAISAVLIAFHFIVTTYLFFMPCIHIFRP